MPIAHQIVRYRLHMHILTAAIAAAWLAWAGVQLYSLPAQATDTQIMLLSLVSDGAQCCASRHVDQPAL